MLEFSEVKKSYNGKTILNIPSLKLENGMYWLQGPNGSGKTTFLRIISGIHPFRGCISFCGIDLHKKPTEYRRQISWADAEPQYPPFLTGHELVSFYRYIRKASSSQTDELISLFSLNDFLDEPIGSYSSGIVKKLSIFLAFIGYPPLILLDEPLSSLDPETVTIVMKLINDSNKELGISFLLSSHQDMEKDFLIMFKKLFVSDKKIIVAQ
jgi:ABC-2 type transport system ATP-binding protein